MCISGAFRRKIDRFRRARSAKRAKRQNKPSAIYKSRLLFKANIYVSAVERFSFVARLGKDGSVVHNSCFCNKAILHIFVYLQNTPYLYIFACTICINKKHNFIFLFYKYDCSLTQKFLKRSKHTNFGNFSNNN